jgi:hypothetical protein
MALIRRIFFYFCSAPRLIHKRWRNYFDDHMTKKLLDLILIATTTIQSFSQTVDTKDICDKVIEIDTVEFNSNFIKSDSFQPTNRFVKADGKLIIRTKDSIYTFTTNNEHGDYNPLFKVVGEDTNKNWVWIEEQGLHSARYFIVNTKTSRVDTLVGPAKMFGDKLVSLEDGYTDSQRIVEIYKIKDDKISLIKKFSLEPCDKLCCVRTIYLKDKTIFLAANDFKEWRAWKIKVFQK